MPQGTKLGPIIFLIMVNDAALSLENRWKYVDDLTVVEVVPKSQPPDLQPHIDTLVDWCNSNDMKPNPAKCKAMQFSFLRTPPPPLHLTINGVQLEIVSSLKLLGLILQSDLRWDEQVKRLISNSSRRLYILTKLKRNGVPKSDLISVYQMYILPMLEYGAPVWSSSITQEQSQCLERVQRRALRIIAYPNLLSYDQLCCDFNIDTLSDRRNLIVTRFANSLLNSKRHRNMLPDTRLTTSGRTLRNSNHLNLPQTRTQRYKQSPIPTMIRAINDST